MGRHKVHKQVARHLCGEDGRREGGEGIEVVKQGYAKGYKNTRASAGGIEQVLATDLQLLRAGCTPFTPGPAGSPRRARCTSRCAGRRPPRPGPPHFLHTCKRRVHGTSERMHGNVRPVPYTVVPHPSLFDHTTRATGAVLAATTVRRHHPAPPPMRTLHTLCMYDSPCYQTVKASGISVNLCMHPSSLLASQQYEHHWRAAGTIFDT